MRRPFVLGMLLVGLTVRLLLALYTWQGLDKGARPVKLNDDERPPIIVHNG